HVSNGAQRWLRLGWLTVQPTDAARIATVVFLAAWLKSHPPAERGFMRGLLPPLLFLGGVAALILAQPNLSSAGLLLAVGMAVLFLAGTPLRYLAIPVV